MYLRKNQIIVAVISAFLISCGTEQVKKVEGVHGKDGRDGRDGKDAMQPHIPWPDTTPTPVRTSAPDSTPDNNNQVIIIGGDGRYPMPYPMPIPNDDYIEVCVCEPVYNCHGKKPPCILQTITVPRSQLHLHDVKKYGRC